MTTTVILPARSRTNRPREPPVTVASKIIRPPGASDGPPPWNGTRGSRNDANRGPGIGSPERTSAAAAVPVLEKMPVTDVALAAKCRTPFRARVAVARAPGPIRSEEHTSELQSPYDLVC